MAIFATVPSAQAAFPGQNGKLAFGEGTLFTTNPDGTGSAPLFTDSSNLLEYHPAWSPAGDKVLFERRSCGPSLCFGQRLWVVEADGSGLQQLTFVPGEAFTPAWAPDGERLLYAGTQGGFETGLDIYSVALDGSNEVRLTNAVNDDHAPAWSPDGSKIAFISVRDGSRNGPGELYVMNSDGTGQTRLTHTMDAELDPNWSPDGSRIVFESVGPSRVIWSVKPDGTDATPLTATAYDLRSPAYSPDGSKIVTVGAPIGNAYLNLYLMNPDGSGLAPITNDSFQESAPDWQPLPSPYPRPKGATPVRVSLVPAYAACMSSNRTHGPPLAFPSCSPPAQESGSLTTGTPDANGAQSNMSGYVLYETILGDPSTPADEADIGLRVNVTDVREQGTLADYAGSIQAQANVRLTDHDGGVTATASDVLFPLTTMCATTPSTAIGSTCSLTTTLDTLIPGAVVEKARTILQLGQVRVFDGGPDGDTATAPNTIFLRQGIFVP